MPWLITEQAVIIQGDYDDTNTICTQPHGTSAHRQCPNCLV